MSLEIVEEALNEMTELAGAACDLLGTLGSLLGAVIAELAQLAEAAINFLLAVIGAVAKFFGALAAVIGDIIGLILGAVSLVAGLIDQLKVFLGKLVALVSAGGCKGVVAAAAALGAGISSAIDSVNSFAESGAVETFKEGVENLASEGRAIATEIESSVKAAADAIEFEIFKAGVTIE